MGLFYFLKKSGFQWGDAGMLVESIAQLWLSELIFASRAHRWPGQHVRLVFCLIRRSGHIQEIPRLLLV